MRFVFVLLALTRGDRFSGDSFSLSLKEQTYHQHGVGMDDGFVAVSTVHEIFCVSKESIVERCHVSFSCDADVLLM